MQTVLSIGKNTSVCSPHIGHNIEFSWVNTNETFAQVLSINQ